MLQSARLKINYPDPLRSDSADVPRDFGSIIAWMDGNAAGFGQGVLAARPTSTAGTPGVQGRFYVATDQIPHQVFYDFGTGWDPVGALATGSIRGSTTGDVQQEILQGSIRRVDLSTQLKPSGTAVAADEALRALGNTASTAAAGNDARLSDQRTPLDTSVTQAKGAAGAFAGQSYGTVFPTVGLYNGYRFTIFLANTSGGSVGVDCIYRADLDGTLPWHTVSGPPISSSGSVSGTWNLFTDLSGAINTPRQGDWVVNAAGGGNGPSQGAGQMRLAVGGSVLATQFVSNNSIDWAIAGIRTGNIAAATAIRLQGNNSNVVVYSYVGYWSAMPIKMI